MYILIFILLFPTVSIADLIVNSQITDSITQSNTKVLGEAPALSVGNLNLSLQDNNANEIAALSENSLIAQDFDQDGTAATTKGFWQKMSSGINGQTDLNETCAKHQNLDKETLCKATEKTNLLNSCSNIINTFKRACQRME